MFPKVNQRLNKNPNSPRIFKRDYIVIELEVNYSNTPSNIDIDNLLYLFRQKKAPPRLQDNEKGKYIPLVRIVSSILFHYDPMCINFGNNSDEYDPEADTIVSMLKHKKIVDDVIEAIILTFRYWFSCNLSVYRTDDKFINMSEQIWSAWIEYH